MKVEVILFNVIEVRELKDWESFRRCKIFYLLIRIYKYVLLELVVLCLINKYI